MESEKKTIKRVTTKNVTYSDYGDESSYESVDK